MANFFDQLIKEISPDLEIGRRIVDSRWGNGFAIGFASILYSVRDRISSPATAPTTPSNPIALPRRVRPFQAEALLSMTVATRQNPGLANATPKQVYEYIKDNGVDIDGAAYDLPAFETWSRYIRDAKKSAHQTDKSAP